MQSSNTNISDQPDLMSTLHPLLACENIKIVTQKGGGNSVVYCVEAGGIHYAVKSYPPYAPGKRDRLAAEAMVYQFLNDHDVQAVPQLKSSSAKDRLIAMEWIDGDIPESYTLSDIEQAIDFIASVAKLNPLPAAKKLPLAAEACLSLSAIIDQVEQRLQRLQHAAKDDSVLNDFLTNEFLPIFVATSQAAKDGYRDEMIPVDVELTTDKRSLIPADFGFHNSIRDRAGQLHFFDFDYFGWDDPVKLLADILWHPKMILSDQQKERFIGGVSYVYRDDETFLIRFHHTFALFGLRWTLIFLNEFLPEFWQNRQHAKVHASQADAKIKQLKRARETLRNVQKIGSLYEIISESSI
tara:strand:- start:38 stop:1099 length:1062 start_codon:yes stop_codon:yes gene_type:complete